MIWPFTKLKSLQNQLAEAKKLLALRDKNFAALKGSCAKQSKMIIGLVDELEVERMRLVACGVGARCNTRESAAKQRVSKESPYYCASVGYVHATVDREMELREKVETYEEALRKLSCLGNGDRPGNSDGNVIALRALEKHSSTKVCIKCGSDMIPMHSEDKKLCSNGACCHEVPWTLEEGQNYQYKRNVEPFVEDRSNVREELEPPRATLERL